MATTKGHAKATTSGRKMAPSVVCFVCKGLVEPKNTLMCMTCNQSFEFDCAGFSEKLYRMMDQNAKKRWRCCKCAQSGKNKPKTPQSNVTLRKKQNPPTITEKIEHAQLNTPNLNMTRDTAEKLSAPDLTGCSEILYDSQILTEHEPSTLRDSQFVADNLQSEDSFVFESPDKLSRSLDCTINNTITILEMKQTIKDLTLELQNRQIDLEITQEELDSKILENNDQKRRIEKLSEEIDVLKTLCKQSSVASNTHSTIKKRKRYSEEFTEILRTYTPPPSTFTSRDQTYFFSPRNKVRSLELKITNLQDELTRANEEIQVLQNQISNLSKKSRNPSVHPCCENIISREKSLISECQKKERKRTIRIFGTQQLVGFASALHHSRENNKYEKYALIAELKSGARTIDVLSNLQKLHLDEEDKIILCLGENDENCETVQSQLRLLLNKLSDFPVFVISINRNVHVNVKTLNYCIKRECKRFKNCYFVDCKYYKTLDICKLLNYHIDYFDYNIKYIKNFKNIIRDRVCNKPSLDSITSTTNQNTHRKGTIPYYFSQKNDAPKSVEYGSRISMTTDSACVTRPTKGVIPYYFPPVKNKHFFRDQRP